MIIPSSKVYLKQFLHGCAVPAIIHNGSYFFVDLEVYENGRIECWHFEDFEGFKKDLQKGWVIPFIPDGQSISIHGLGEWKISNGRWLYDKNTFLDYVQSVIRHLNPHLNNIFQYREKKYKNMIMGESGRGTAYKVKHQEPYDLYPIKTDGNGVNLFYKDGNQNYLVKVNVFADETLQIERLETPLQMSFAQFEHLINDKIISTDLPEDEVLQIYGLGEFSIKPVYKTDVHEKLLELKDMLSQLKGEPSVIELCKQAFEHYIANPSHENKEKLKVAYENVPEHKRIYVGDMDTKDIQVRMIIYGDQEIENWSHFKLAQKFGEKLPSITVPKPKE